MILRSAQHSTQTLCTSVSHIFFIPLNSMNAFPCGLPRKRAFLPLYYIELRVCVWAYTLFRWYKCWSFVKKKRKQDPEMRPYTALLWTTMFKNRRIHKLSTSQALSFICPQTFLCYNNCPQLWTNCTAGWASIFPSHTRSYIRLDSKNLYFKFLKNAWKFPPA